MRALARATPGRKFRVNRLYLMGTGGHADRMSLLRLLFVIAFWLCIAGAYVFAILPGKDAPSAFAWDKMNHMLAFFVVTVLGRLAYPRASVPLIAVAMAAFGGFIELSQAVPFIHRDAQWADWFADCIATAIGLVVVWPLAKLADRRRAQRGTFNGR